MKKVTRLKLIRLASSRFKLLMFNSKKEVTIILKALMCYGSRYDLTEGEEIFDLARNINRQYDDEAEICGELIMGRNIDEHMQFLKLNLDYEEIQLREWIQDFKARRENFKSRRKKLAKRKWITLI